MNVVNNVSVIKWKEFINSFPFANIFHSPEMAKVFEQSDGFETFPLFVTDENNILAFALAVLVFIDKPGPKKFTNRLIMYSSPLYEENAKGYFALNMLLEHAKSIAKKAVFLEIRNSEKFPKSEKVIVLNNSEYLPYQNYLIDLSKGSEIIWNSLKSTVRNNCKKFSKKGAIIREMEQGELDTCIKLMEKLYKSKNIPFINKSIFHNAYRLLAESKMIRIIVMDYNSQIIGVRMSLNYLGIVYDWYAAADSNFNKFFPNDGLVWDTLEWASKENYLTFDFGGGAIKGEYYGPAKFKEKYKGELVEFGRYRIISNKIAYFVGLKTYNLLKKIKN